MSPIVEAPSTNGDSGGVFGNGFFETEHDSPLKDDDDNETPHRSIRVSFREGTKAPSSHRSMNDMSISDTSHSSGSNLQHYSRLRSNLTRSQLNRNPLYFYQVTKTLGEGSMGDVKLVVKRKDKIGGSARRDIQQAVKRQQFNQKCLKLPLIGGVFHFCIDGDLKDNVSADGSSHHSNKTRTPNTSTHSVLSLFGGSQDKSATDADRSFEDSLLGNSADEDETNNVYAMKSILIDQVARQEFVDELRNEIAILRDLDHPNIVRAIETFEWKGAISIVMEVCSGGDLYSRDPYSEEDANRIIRSVLSAIAYMHSRNVAHRDLKYENILFVNSSHLSEVKLIDFGLSRVYQDTAHLTDIAGTIYTMAPEVLKGFHTEKADLWSIGVLTYMLLVSSLPFYGRDRDSIVKKIFRNKPSFREKRWKNVSKEAKTFIIRLLVSDPDKRADAETALQLPWIANRAVKENAGIPSQIDISSEQESLVRAAILRYAKYPELKKMALMVVAHKSSSDEIGILKKVFKHYDKRHDGSIWFGDFCDNMQQSKLSGDELRDVFDAMDLAGSGRVRYTEFIAATVEVHGTINETRLAEAFDRLDCDDSGFITVANLMELLGKEVLKEDAEEIIREVDKDKDGSVSYSEYLGMWEHDDTAAQTTKSSIKVLKKELSSMITDSDGSDLSPSDAFLQQKHLQNTLHTWAMEMQLPPHEFAMGCSFLHQVALGQLSNVEEILEIRPGFVNFRDYDRRTALHVAASEGFLDICEFLVRKGARINRGDRWGGFPLDDAHRHRHTDVMTFLHMEGAQFGSTPQKINLITAASEGNVKEVKELLAFGSIDLNQGDYDKRTALHLAAHGGHVKVVKILCDAGADVNVKDRWGDKPLDDAKKAKLNVQEMVDVLTGKAASALPGDSGHSAAATMDALKEQPNGTNLKSKGSSDEDDTLQMSIPEFAMGCSLLHQAAVGNLLVCRKIVLERPKLASFQDYDRRTPLMIAASEGQLEICKFLLSKGARINRVDRWGHAPLDDAYQFGHKVVVKFLRDQGAKFGSTSQITNFITAASEGDADEVEAFLQHGSMDINQGDYDGRTALHLAAGEGQLEIVTKLCEAGADVNVEDRWGHCPLDDAASAPKNAIGVTKALVKHGAKSKKALTTMKSTFVGLLPS